VSAINAAPTFSSPDQLRNGVVMVVVVVVVFLSTACSFGDSC
jgi:hypothetical protein